MNLPPPAPCTICRAVDELTRQPVLIAPREGKLTQRREGTTRDYPVAVYECSRCGAVREQPCAT